LIERGIVTPNTCGKASASQKPGELTIFVSITTLSVRDCGSFLLRRRSRRRHQSR
jgi:hypothetical protein